MKRVLVIDGQGGRIGALVVKRIKELADVHIICVGTNYAATAAMLKAGAHEGATGENAAIVCSRNADYIVGPLGMVIADALLGEITPKMAAAIGASSAKRLLIPPFDHCNNIVAGLPRRATAELIEQALADIVREIDEA